MYYVHHNSYVEYILKTELRLQPIVELLYDSIVIWEYRLYDNIDYMRVWLYVHHDSYVKYMLKTEPRKDLTWIDSLHHYANVIRR